jgi:hypothetical protein
MRVKAISNVRYTRDFVIPTKEESGYNVRHSDILRSDSSFVGMTKSRIYLTLETMVRVETLQCNVSTNCNINH